MWKPRFSLISILIVFLLLALVFAFYVAPRVRRAKELEMIAKIDTNAVEIKESDFDQSGYLIELKCINSNDRDRNYQTIVSQDAFESFQKLKKLSFTNCDLESLSGITKLPNLESLTFLRRMTLWKNWPKEVLMIKQLRLSEATELYRFPDMPILDELVIGHTGGHWLFLPKEMRSPPQGFDFEILARFPKLKKVTLLMIEVTDVQGLEKLNELEELHFSGSQLYGLDGVDKLKVLQSLKIEFDANPEPEKFDLTPLLNCKDLKKLVCPSNWPAEHLEKLRLALPNCEIQQQVAESTSSEAD